MTEGSAFELHSLGMPWQVEQPPAWSRLPQRGRTAQDTAPLWHILPIPTTGQPLRLGPAASGQQLAEVEDPQASLAEFWTIQRQTGPALVMMTDRPYVLVNGVPAMSLTVLRPRDTLGLLPGQPHFVTQRIRPYVGPPPSELLGIRCPRCKIPLASETRIVRHRCGVVLSLRNGGVPPAR